MKTKILLNIILLISSISYSQVGINNSDPKTTLDVSAKRDGLGAISDNTQKYGLQAPRLTRAEMTALTSSYGADQKGAMIYITDVSGGDNSGTRVNMDAVGYYYFDGSVWQKLSGGGSSGDATNDAWVNDTANTMVKLGTKSDGSSRDAGTDFVAKDNGSVGIGTASPNASAILDVTSTTKGFLPPRMTSAQKNAISSPATGLVLFCSDCNSCNNSGGELQVYTGSGAGQGWKCVGGSGGTSVFTADCSTATMNGSLSAGDTATATITMSVNVSSLGTYNIQSSMTDGVQFSANGTFTSTGIQTVTLYPVGTPVNSGSYTWTISSGGSTCSVSSSVQSSKSTRMVKVLSLLGNNDLGTNGSSYFNNFVNNNSGEFGPSGIVKLGTVSFTTLAYNSINSANLSTTFAQYDIVYLSGPSGTGNNTWDNATENAFVSYLATHQSVVILEGDDYSATSDITTILAKLNCTTITGTQNGTMYWDAPLTNFQVSPIKGTFGNVTGYGYSSPNGSAWAITTARTDLAFIRSTAAGNPIVGFWDASNYLFYTGDDDGLTNSIYTMCSNNNPKSTTTCTASPYTMRGARWFANLIAFTVNNTTPKAYITD
jgi:hypothetical protein